MTAAKLRRVGGSLMVAIPSHFAEELHVSAQSDVNLSLEDGALVLRPARPRYKLEDLLAECEPAAPLSAEDRAWLSSPPVGREV